MDEICRFCLADISAYNIHISYNQKIQLLMPEIDLSMTPTVTLCEDCSNSLNSAYIFKQKCLQNEEVIKNYINKTQTALINLRCVRGQIQSKESFNEVKVKEEYDNVDNNSTTNQTHLVDCKDITSISEEYHLIFPKEEIFQQQEDELASYRYKEQIEGEEENESLQVFVCEICMESFKNPIELNQHRIVHSQRNVVQQQKWTNHPRKEEIKNADESESTEVYLCETCNKTIKTPIELDQHPVEHSKVKIFPCNICDKTFFQKVRLKRHKTTHSNNKPKPMQYFCDICNRGFKQQYILDKHKLVHSNRVYTCSICSKNFPNLQDHIRLCHTTKHICEVCNMKFETEILLRNHTRTHTSDSPYKCEICGTGFTVKRIFDRHMLNHEQDKKRSSYRRNL